MTAVRLRELDFVLFPHGTKPGLRFGAWWQKTKFAQDIDHGALNTSLRTNIFHVLPKQKFRNYLLSTAHLIGTLATRMRAVYGTTALRRRRKPIFAPGALQFRHAFRHVT